MVAALDRDFHPPATVIALQRDRAERNEVDPYRLTAQGAIVVVRYLDLNRRVAYH